MTEHCRASAIPRNAFAGLAMRPGRRRMLDLLTAAGPAGVAGEALCRAFYDDGPIPRGGWASARCQIQRLRSQLTPLGFGIVSASASGGETGVYVLEAKGPRPVVEAPPPPPGFRGAAALGIRPVQRMVMRQPISLARVAYIDGAVP